MMAPPRRRRGPEGTRDGVPLPQLGRALHLLLSSK